MPKTNPAIPRLDSMRKCVQCLIRIGLGQTYVSGIYGIHHQQFKRLKHEIGIEGRLRNRNTKTKGHFKCAKCLFRVGYGIKSVCRLLRLPQTTARHIRERAGTPKRQRPSINITSRKGINHALSPKQEQSRLERMANALIMGEYRKEEKALMKFDEQYHWGNHPQVVGWIRNKRLVDLEHSNPNVRIRRRLRKRIWKVLKRQGVTKQEHTMRLTGCSSAMLVRWIQKHFKRGMSWRNYGKWEVDHVVPCASFDLTKPEQQRQCFHYTNLRPLWRKDNREKHANIVQCQPELILSI